MGCKLRDAAAKNFSTLPSEVKAGVQAALDAVGADPVGTTTIKAAGRRTYVHPDPVDGNGKIYITFLYGRAFPVPEVLRIEIDHTADDQGVH